MTSLKQMNDIIHSTYHVGNQRLIFGTGEKTPQKETHGFFSSLLLMGKKEKRVQVKYTSL